MVNVYRGKEYDPILPARPPLELIPEGYARKVAVMWLSFLGILFGAASYGTALAVILPVSLLVLGADLLLLIFGRFKDKPLWQYKRAQEYYHRGRYDKALRKLDEIMEARPDMEEKLLPAVMVCRNRLKDYEGAGLCCQRLLQEGKIGGECNPGLLIEVLSILKRAGDWSRISWVARHLPEDDIYREARDYYMGIACCEMGQAVEAALYPDRIEGGKRTYHGLQSGRD